MEVLRRTINVRCLNELETFKAADAFILEDPELNFVFGATKNEVQKRLFEKFIYEMKSEQFSLNESIDFLSKAKSCLEKRKELLTNRIML